MGRDKDKKVKKSKKEKHGKDDRKGDRKSKNGAKKEKSDRKRSPSYDSYYYDDDDYEYYSYSESRSPSRHRDRRGKRGGRSRSRRGGRDRDRGRSRDRRRSPPRRDVGKGGKGGKGGFIQTSGPRSPSRDGSPSNAWIFNMLVDREKARVKRDFGEADRIRDELRSKGVEILERERRWNHRDGRSGARPNADDEKK
eukprot:TRINITY_DN54077_c0_g1_i1.p1 TRINITY_DN54077_c0_g1~~TRINITY_DN54077_c0_g1_i1.p1  ORF type:complete len:196 (+),score=39.13 TRINITY_DN54077_c0_g1_i1:84-671(+)